MSFPDMQIYENIEFYHVVDKSDGLKWMFEFDEAWWSKWN